MATHCEPRFRQRLKLYWTISKSLEIWQIFLVQFFLLSAGKSYIYEVVSLLLNLGVAERLFWDWILCIHPNSLHKKRCWPLKQKHSFYHLTSIHFNWKKSCFLIWDLFLQQSFFECFWTQPNRKLQRTACLGNVVARQMPAAVVRLKRKKTGELFV